MKKLKSLSGFLKAHGANIVTAAPADEQGSSPGLDDPIKEGSDPNELENGAKQVQNNYAKKQRQNKKPLECQDTQYKGKRTPKSCQIKKKGYMRISSRAFANTELYPKIPNSAGVAHALKYNKGTFFRTNEAYNEEGTEQNPPPSDEDFYFRINENNFWYTATESDKNVLGIMMLEDIGRVERMDDYGSEPECFTVLGQLNEEWKLCPEDIQARDKWVCKIKLLKKEYDEECDAQKQKGDEQTETIIKPHIVIPQSAGDCYEDWNYENGGDDWKCSCSAESNPLQSPIDLPSKNKAIKSKIAPEFKYFGANKPDGMNEGEVSQSKLLRIENGVKLWSSNFGEITTKNGSVYKAQEVSFHVPAEHTIGGKKFDMEIQVIHYGDTKGDIGNQAILSFLFEKSHVVLNKFLEELDVYNLPSPDNPSKNIIKDFYIPDLLEELTQEKIEAMQNAKMAKQASQNSKSANSTSATDNKKGQDKLNSKDSTKTTQARDLRMKKVSFYTYLGTTTTPPCYDNTIHYVVADPIKLSPTVINRFKEAIMSKESYNGLGEDSLDGVEINNARNIQPTKDRPVFFYQGEDKAPDADNEEPPYHEEVVNEEFNMVFKVPGAQPSGYPGAIVVPKEEAEKYDSAQKNIDAMTSKGG